MSTSPTKTCFILLLVRVVSGAGRASNSSLPSKTKGTLNLEPSVPVSLKKGIKYKDKFLFPCEVNGEKGFIVEKRENPPNLTMLEVCSDKHLRTELKLKDGDEVLVKIGH